MEVIGLLVIAPPLVTRVGLRLLPTQLGVLQFAVIQNILGGAVKVVINDLAVLGDPYRSSWRFGTQIPNRGYNPLSFNRKISARGVSEHLTLEFLNENQRYK